MSKIAFITDSTAYIPQNLVEHYNITVLPQILIWGEETLRDGVDITPTAFYERLAKAKIMPTSSQVPIPTMQEAYQTLFAQGYDEIICIFISSKLSGTLQSAYQAQKMMGADAEKIHIVDSYSTSMGLGFQVLAAARAYEQGASAKDCLQAAQRIQAQSGVYFTVETLEFLHRGGRIGGAQNLVGTMLNLKPLLSIQNGRVESIEKIRTKRKAVARVKDIVMQNTKGQDKVHLAVIHANARAEAEALQATMQQALNPVEIFLADVSPVVGTHTGPGVVGIVYAYE